MSFYIISAVTSVIYIALSWLMISKMHLSGEIEMIVRILMVGLVAGVFGFVYQLRERRQRASEQQAAGQTGQPQGYGGEATDREVESFLKDAERRLMGSRLGKDARLGNLPLFLVLGETASAKTCTLVQSGTEPDLLAGQVYQDNNILPTRPLNLWLAKDAVLVEAGGKLLNEPERWRHLIRSLRPASQRWSLFRGKPQAPRAAILCVEADQFLNASEDALAANSRAIQERLGDAAQILGVSLPVYVLFTKLDRIACFSEFCANLAKEEVNQVLGVTLPFSSSLEKGVYGEQQARRLTIAFDNLAGSLCDKRIPFLARDDDPAQKSSVYEFPREFRKLRNPIVRFLVDVCRPSQLRCYPILRGFYFSGVRPVVVQESAPLPKRASLAQQTAHATGLFAVNDPPAQTAATAAQIRLRRIPQWLFLGHLFNHVILRDRSAMGASAYSVHSENTRRAAFIAGGTLFLLWAAISTVSYLGNRELESQVSEAARGIAQFETGGGAQDLPSQSSLQRLDTLRQSVQLLSAYNRDGAPWRLRFGLYVGKELYVTSRRLYFERFRQLLFGSTQSAILAYMKQLPPRPGPNDEYKPGYDALKAYLMTTSHHEKSNRNFLSPVLQAYWTGVRQVDPERAALARRQFDFYADELLIANPYKTDNDAGTVRNVREYLKSFNAVERIYQSILAQASQKHRSVNFNNDVPGSAVYVASSKDIAGAFTIDGWKTVDEAIHNIRRMFESEAWVLGDDAYGALDPDKLVPELTARYHRDFIGNWRAYLASSHVAGFRDLGDAAQKLKQLSSNQSYLLRLFCLASIHTSVKDEATAAPYQPVQYVESSNCSERWVQDNNKSYISALTSLQLSIERVAQSGANIREDLVDNTRSETASAYRVTGQIAQNFRIDKEGNVHQMVQQIMEEPIRYAENLLGRLGPAQVNAQGRQFCNSFLELANKYPFNPNSQVDVPLAEFDGIFRPGDGRLDQFYETSLKNYLNRQGAVFTRKADSKVTITDAFLGFMNRAAAVSDAMYKGGSKEVRLAYAMKALPAPNIKSVILNLDGQILNSTGAGGASKDFVWPGTTHSAKLGFNFGGPTMDATAFDGVWAVFRLFGDADQFQPNGNSQYTLQWVPRQGQSAQPLKVDGKAVTLPFQLDLKGAPPLFQKGYFAGLRCVSEVAR